MSKKIEEELSQLKKTVTDLKDQISQMQFRLLGMIPKIDKLSEGGGGGGGSGTVDMGPIEEKLLDLQEKAVSRNDFDSFAQNIEEMLQNREKALVDMIDRLNNLITRGLAIADLESTLMDLKSQLDSFVSEEVD